MYLDFYGLTKNPFHITPDPEFLYSSPTHKEAWASIIYGVEKRKGFVAITGEVGVGKTTVLRSYLEGMSRPHLIPIYVFNANLSFENLLKLILREMEIEYAGAGVHEMVDRLHLALIDEYKQGRNVVLVIDEAQNMPVDTLENLRMLSNLETSKDKLLQIVLVGQLEFEMILNLHELRQLRQRVAIRSEIKPLNFAESIEYIDHRLKKAGQKSASIFSKAAVNRIAKEAKGIPRVINILCDNALITGFGYQKKPVTARVVREVLSDLKLRRRPPVLKWSLFSFLIAVIAIVSYAVATYPRLWQEILRSGRTVFSSAQTLQGESLNAPSLPQNQFKPAANPLQTTATGVVRESIPSNAGADPNTDQSSPVSQDIAVPGATQNPSPVNADKSPLDVKPETPPSPPSHDEKKADAALPALQLQPKAGASAHLNTETKKDDGKSKPTPKTIESSSAAQTTQTMKTVEKGDCLTRLILETYGHVDKELVELVRQNNPEIKDINMLHVGNEVRFPNIK